MQRRIQLAQTQTLRTYPIKAKPQFKPPTKSIKSFFALINNLVDLQKLIKSRYIGEKQPQLTRSDKEASATTKSEKPSAIDTFRKQMVQHNPTRSASSSSVGYRILRPHSCGSWSDATRQMQASVLASMNPSTCTGNLACSRKPKFRGSHIPS